MRRRTTFERTLVRRQAKKGDFLRYIEYESGVEALRRKRCARVGKGEHGVSDYSLVRRQFEIYERALRRFKSDVGLWTAYIEAAQREKATTLVGRVVARAIQMHPSNAGLYILGARHELELGSPAGARALLQRGLRHTDALWLEYAQMELWFVDSVHRRWTVLGLEMPEELILVGQEAVRRAVSGELFLNGRICIDVC